jgi:hypothetical protein
MKKEAVRQSFIGIGNVFILNRKIGLSNKFHFNRNPISKVNWQQWLMQYYFEYHKHN